MVERFNRRNRKSVLHFLEFNVREWQPIFTLDLFARMALLELRSHCDYHPAKLTAYVVMPTHMHAIINPRDGDAEEFVRTYKAAISRACRHLAEERHRDDILQWLLHTPDGHPQAWQDGKHDFHLWSERLIWQKINYVHNNPIKAGLVRHANGYPYSSFNAWYGTPGEVIVPINRDFWWEDLVLDDDGG